MADFFFLGPKRNGYQKFIPLGGKWQFVQGQYLYNGVNFPSASSAPPLEHLQAKRARASRQSKLVSLEKGTLQILIIQNIAGLSFPLPNISLSDGERSLPNFCWEICTTLASSWVAAKKDVNLLFPLAGKEKRKRNLGNSSFGRILSHSVCWNVGKEHKREGLETATNFIRTVISTPILTTRAKVCAHFQNNFTGLVRPPSPISPCFSLKLFPPQFYFPFGFQPSFRKVTLL